MTSFKFQTPNSDEPVAQSENQMADDRFQQLADALPSMVWICRPDGQADFFSRCWYENTGQSPEEAMGWGWGDVIHPDDRDRMFAFWEKTVCSSTTHEIQLRYRMSRGDYRWHQVRAQPMSDESGEITHWIGISNDIEDSHQSLENSEALTDTVAAELRGHTEVLECLARGESLASVLTKLIECAEESRPGMLGSVLLLDEKTGCLRHGASVSLPDFYCQAIDGVKIGPRAGSCGTAAFTGQRVIVEDVSTSDLWDDYCDLAAQARLGACWSEPIFSSSGQVLGTFAMYCRTPRKPDAHDLTFVTDSANLAALAIERVRADMSQRRLAAIVESTDAAVIGKRLDGTIDSWNREAEQIFGYTADEVIGQPISLLVPEDRREELTMIFERLERGERIDQFETIRIVKDGRRIDVSLMWSHIRDTHGEAIGYSTIARDITKRKQAERNDRERQRQLSTLMSNLPGAAYRCQNDKHRTMEFISEGCRDLCGHSAATIVAREPAWGDLIHQGDKDEIWSTVQSSLAERRAFQVVYRVRHLDGSERWIWEQGRGVFSDDGDLLALEGLMTDMTELHNARQQLVQSERLAAIGQMLSAIAHESRNALQRIQVGVDMLGFEIDDDSESMGDLQRICRAKDDLHRLFEELRSYAAPIQLDRADHDLRNVWDDAWSQLEQSRRERDAQLIVEVDNTDCTCSVDSFRVEQVFRNLFENSLAACSDPVRITIRCHETEIEGTRTLRISVRDNGPGLNDEQRDCIFDAFFTSKPKGTGLGMAIALRIIQAHCGSLLVGEQSDGAEFLLTLPIVQGLERWLPAAVSQQ